MFEGNTISSKDNNVTLLSKKTAAVWKVAPFLRKVLSFENTSQSFEANASLTKKKHDLSCPLCLKVAPILRKECDSHFKETQLQFICKGTPLN